MRRCSLFVDVCVAACCLVFVDVWCCLWMVVVVRRSLVVVLLLWGVGLFFVGVVLLVGRKVLLLVGGWPLRLARCC